MKELSEHYFIDERGKLCCWLGGNLLDVFGVFQYESGYLHFKHKVVTRTIWINIYGFVGMDKDREF